MSVDRREYSTTDEKGRRQPGRRMVKLPGERNHVARSDSAVYIARKLVVDKMEKRIRDGR